MYKRQEIKKAFEEATKKTKKMKKKQEFLNNMKVLAMSVPDYELMAYNTQELKRYINELKEVVVYYRKVTTNDKGE
mgnify:CR=1 FL=1